jgi:hypothetical protein
VSAKGKGGFAVNDRTTVYYPRKRQSTRNQRKRKLLIEQRLMGLVMIVITAVFVWMCASANEDCTAALLTGPIGLIMLFSKKVWIV